MILLFLASACGASQTAAPASSSTVQSTDLASMDIERLMDIKVTTASLFSDKLGQAPSIMSVVTSDELRRFGGTTLGEVLARVPGLTQTSESFDDRSVVAVDGDDLNDVAGGHILILINGRPTREVMAGGIISDLLESFPIEILERIEIIRGPGSVLYGSNAFSAVINLITRKAESNQAAVRVQVGPNGALVSSGHFFYKRGDFSMVGASQIHEVPNWPIAYLLPPGPPASEAVSWLDRGTGDYLGMSYKGLRFISSFTELQTTFFEYFTTGESRLTRDFADLGYEHKARANWEMDFNATYTRSTFGTATAPIFIARDSDEFVGEWTNLITLTSKDRLTAGVLVNRIAGKELDALFTPPLVAAQDSRPAGAFYAQLDHHLLPSLKLIGGFQSNKSAGIPFSTVPRVGAIWSPAKWASIKVLYGQAFRPPSIDETFINVPQVVGNPKLRPETVATFNVGLSLQFTRLQFGVDYFHSHQSHSIVATAGTPIQFANLDGVTFNGAEGEGKYYFRRDFFAQGSVLYQTNHDADGVTNVTPIPAIGFKAGVSYESHRGLVCGLFEASDGKARMAAPHFNPLTGWRHMLHAELRQDISRLLHVPEGSTVAIAAHADDLLDQAVWVPGSFDTVPMQQGRTIYAGLEFSHGKH